MLNLLFPFIILTLDIASATPLPQEASSGQQTISGGLNSPCKIKDVWGVCNSDCPNDISFVDNPCNAGLDCCVAIACAENNSGACMNRSKIGNCFNGLTTSQGGTGRGMFSNDHCPGGHSVGCCVEDVNAQWTALDRLGMEPGECQYGCSGPSGSMTDAVAAFVNGGSLQWTGGETAASGPGLN